MPDADCFTYLLLLFYILFSQFFFQDGLHRLKQMVNSKSRHNIAYTIKNLLLNIGKSFTVKATKNKQTNQQKTSYYLFDEKYRSKKNQTLLLSCLMIHSTRPQWRFLTIFVQKIFADTESPWATPWFHEKKPIKNCLYICVPKVTKKAQATVKNETEPKKFRRPRYIQSIVVLLTHYILINFALILNQKIK